MLYVINMGSEISLKSTKFIGGLDTESLTHEEKIVVNTKRKRMLKSTRKR